MANAEKQARWRKRAMARLATYDLALREIIKIKDSTDMTVFDRMSAMAAVAEAALARDDE